MNIVTSSLCITVLGFVFVSSNMQKEYTIEAQFETRPTRTHCDDLLKDVVSGLMQMENLDNATEPTNKSVLPIIRRGDSHYWVEISSEYGKQEDGFLIEIEVRAGGDHIEPAEAEDVAQSVSDAVKAAFPVTRKVR